MRHQEKKGGGKIDFVRPGEKRKKSTPSPLRSYLDGAGDWSLQVDLDGRLRVPERVSETNLRPDSFSCRTAQKEWGLWSSQSQVKRGWRLQGK